MPDEKPFTKADLTAALKEFAGVLDKKFQEQNGKFAEKLEILRKRIDDDQFEQRTEFFVKMTRPEIKNVREATQEGFSQVDKRLERLEGEVHWMKDDIKGLASDLALAPTRKKVTELEERMEVLENTNVSL